LIDDPVSNEFRLPGSRIFAMVHSAHRICHSRHLLSADGRPANHCSRFFIFAGFHAPDRRRFYSFQSGVLRFHFRDFAISPPLRPCVMRDHRIQNCKSKAGAQHSAPTASPNDSSRRGLSRRDSFLFMICRVFEGLSCASPARCCARIHRRNDRRFSSVSRARVRSGSDDGRVG